MLHFLFVTQTISACKISAICVASKVTNRNTRRKFAHSTYKTPSVCCKNKFHHYHFIFKEFPSKTAPHKTVNRKEPHTPYFSYKRQITQSHVTWPKMEITDITPVRKFSLALSSTIDVMDFDALVEQLTNELASDKPLEVDDIDHEHLIHLMKQYNSQEREWNRFSLRDKSRNYTRNGVQDISVNANLLILVWEPGKGSFIHDHASAHCVMKILKGNLEEILYRAKSQERPILEKRTLLKKNDVAYINDQIGLHKMVNPSKDKVAVSLHLYTPPYAAKFGCSYWEDETGEKHHVKMSSLYSWKGQVVNVDHSTC